MSDDRFSKPFHESWFDPIPELFDHANKPVEVKKTEQDLVNGLIRLAKELTIRRKNRRMTKDGEN